MKKKFALALALALTLSLTACNKPEPAPAAPSPSETITETAPVAPTPEPTPEQPEEAAPTESTPEQPEETPAVEVAPEEPISTEPIEEPSPAEPVDLFTDTSETVYATSTVNIRSEPDANSKKVGQLNWSDSVLRTGVGFADTSGWSEVELADGSTAYVSSKYLTTIKPEPKPVEQQKPVEKPVEKPTEKPVQPTVKDDDDITPEQKQADKETEQNMIESLHQDAMDMMTGSGDLYDGKPDENGNYSAYELAEMLKENPVDGVEFVQTDEGVIGFEIG